MQTNEPVPNQRGTVAERAAAQLTAAPMQTFLLNVAPFTLSVFDGAGGRIDFGPGSTAFVAPLSEIIFGTGAGITSSPNFLYAVATALLTLRDLAGNPLMAVDGAVATRTVTFTDAAGVTVLGLSLTAAGRQIAVIDDANQLLLNIDTKAAGRVLTLADSASAAMLIANTIAATRTMDFVDQAGVRVMGALLVAASSGVAFGPKAASAIAFWDNVTLFWETYNAAAALTRSLDAQTGTVSVPAVTPAAMAAIENDYALAIGEFCRLTGNAANTSLTGIVAGRDGERKVIANIAAPTITIEFQNVGSAAANRFQTKTGLDVVLALDGTIEFIYDGTTGFWREI